MLNYITAQNEIMSFFNDAWAAQTILDPFPRILWYPIIQTSTKPKDFHVNCQIQTYMEKQKTLAKECRLYETNGAVFIQIFAPLQPASNITVLRHLAAYAKLIFRGKNTANGVDFFDVRIDECNVDDGFYHINVISSYKYFERE